MKYYLLKIFLLTLFYSGINSQKPVISAVEFDESEIDRCKLTLRWNVNNSNSELDRYMMVFERTEVERQNLKLKTNSVINDIGILKKENFFFFNLFKIVIRL
jgi:hypothetical protein